MARKIRFPLKMKNGAEVRTLDELKENFDLESVLGYFTDGKLTTWLADRYYDEKSEAVSALSADTPELNAKLCNILEVEYQGDDDVADLEYIQRRNEKLRILSAYTDNKDILNNIDIVAMSQDELFDILDEQPDKVYLYGEKFEIPFGAKNISYIGIKSPLVVLDRNKYSYEYNEAGITFTGVSYEDNINPFITLGEKLFVFGHYRKAYSHIEQSAENGNPRAMYLMGLYYYWGYNTVHIDTSVRNSWFKKGYEGGDPLASYWYARWCLKDGSEEQTSIYRNIFNGIKRMADSGDNFAQHTLGSMYENGRGVDKNKDSALDYYKRSADQGNAFAECNYGGMFNNENGDYYKATEWYRKSAEQGCALGQYNLARKYEYGKGIPQDYCKAFEWYMKAAEQGYDAAQDVLGDMYYYGEGIQKDYEKALVWYSKAAEQSNKYSQYSLGLMYYHGLGVPIDYSKANEWFLKSAKQQVAAAQCAIGNAYYFGEGYNESIDGAVYWYKKAAEQENADAEFQLGYMYGTGRGLPKDKNKAIELFKKSFAHGNKEAKENLRKLGVYI